MITMEDNKRKFKVGDTVELIKDIDEFKKGSLFIVISNIRMCGADGVKAKSKLNSKEYWMYNNELKLYESNDEKEILNKFSDDWGLYCLDRELNVDEALEKVMKDIEESNKKDSNDALTLSQVLKELADEWQEQDLNKLKKNNISKDKNTKSKFNIKPMNIIINRGLFKGQRCEIISEEDKIYTVRLLDDDNFNIIKINKSDLLAQNEHKDETGTYYFGVFKYRIKGNKTVLMNKHNEILTSTVCDESDIFNKNKALEICRYKNYINKHKEIIKREQSNIKDYQKELNKLINE